jgi:pimeloyl-ACP methyl ester carboxylesterase
MLDIERRRLVLSGKDPAAVNAALRVFAGFYVETLERGQTPAQAIAAHPEWKAYWYDEPEHQYGRRMRYYQQLQKLDVEGAWREVAVQTLIVWGEYDWIMGRDESARAAAILRARDPSLVRYVIRPGMNHHFYVFKDLGAAFAEKGGTFDAGAANEIAAWIRSQTR